MWTHRSPILGATMAAVCAGSSVYTIGFCQQQYVLSLCCFGMTAQAGGLQETPGVIKPAAHTSQGLRCAPVGHSDFKIVRSILYLGLKCSMCSWFHPRRAKLTTHVKKDASPRQREMKKTRVPNHKIKTATKVTAKPVVCNVSQIVQ